MGVLCDVEEIELESNFTDRLIPSVLVTCSRCNHHTESFGTSIASVRRCLALMREECPLKQHNYYDVDDYDDDYDPAG
jgi:hypothetical protein